MCSDPLRRETVYGQPISQTMGRCQLLMVVQPDQLFAKIREIVMNPWVLKLRAAMFVDLGKVEANCLSIYCNLIRFTSW